MFIDDFDRTRKNGCLRFIEFWKKVSEEKGCIKIIENSDEPRMYALEYDTDEDKEFIILIDKGITLFFPLYPNSDKSFTINFSDDIVETNLASLFKLLNNKKNFHTV